MAWQLLNRALATGTVDGDGDITASAAEVGFQDFSAITPGNTTYVTVVQGTNWAWLRVQKVGSILRPQATLDSSASGNPITFDTGLPIKVFSDVGRQKLVYIDGSDEIQNADAIFNSFAPATLVDLKIAPLPESGGSVRYLRSIVANDSQGAFYVWDPDESATGDDFNYVVSTLSATGRWVRQKQITDIVALASDNDARNSTLYRVGAALRHKGSAGAVKQVPTVENFKQASYATLAALKAVASSKWADGNVVELRGILADGDIDPLNLTWVAASTNTDALDVSFIRPDDISGSNAGRFSIPVPVKAITFTNSDATPSVKDGVLFQVAATPPASITAFDDMRNGQTITIQADASAAQVIAHNGTSMLMPNAENFTLAAGAASVQFYKENGVVRMVGGSGGGGTVVAGDVTVTPAGNIASTDVQAALVELQGDIDGIAAGGVANDSVTNPKLADMAQATVKGRALSAGTGDPTDLSQAQLTALVNTFTTSLSGAVAAPGTVTGKLLSDDGTWVSPASGGAAADITVADAANNYTSGNVEGALLEAAQKITQAAKSASYELVLADAGKTIVYTGSSGGQTMTIPTNASVAFPIGTVLTFVNAASAAVSLSVSVASTDVLRNSGDGTAGNRSLARYGIATCIKVTATEWFITGTGMT